MRQVAFAILLVVQFFPLVAEGQGSQFADAMADVVTFGAWGQQRDQHDAEMARLQKLHEEEIQRLKNSTEAQISATRVSDSRTLALSAQYTGQHLLVIISLVDAVIAQVKVDIAERYETNTNIQNFADWYDAQRKSTSDEIDSLVDLLRKTTKLDQDSIDAVLKTAKLSHLERDKQAAEAEKYLKKAIESSRWASIERELSTLIEIRTQLSELLEDQRKTLREAVQKMSEEDIKRRVLCAPNPIAIKCNQQGANCTYYQAAPGPCGDIVYINWFPVSYIKEIFDNLKAYKTNAEFFVDIGRIDAPGNISLRSYQSSEEIFAQNLKEKPLVPTDFHIPDSCGNYTHLRNRLLEGIKYASIFSAVPATTKETRERLVWLQNEKPYLVFGLKGLDTIVGKKIACDRLSAETKSHLDLLATAVIALEDFGEYLTANQFKKAEEKDLLKPVQQLADEL